jgi:PncC family amidohydrolase
MFSKSLINQVKKILKKAEEKNLKIAIAESCTGGLLSGLFTEIPGSSKVFDRAFVTYSNAAKNEMLGVKKETLKNFGAVSEEAAREMAEGVIKNSASQIAIAITGIAGPDGETKRKPVGLVYIGICQNKKTSVKKFNFSGNRQEIRLKSIEAALKIIIL